MNIRDSEIMAQKLAESGYVESADMDQASVVIINTCSIRAKAEQKVFSLLGSLRKNKKMNPDLKICVAGCVAQQEGQQLIARMPHVDLVIGTQHIYDLPKLLEQTEHEKISINLSDSYEIPRFIPRLPTDDNSSLPAPEFQFNRFVTIMQGCNNFCTYCVVPFTRGREVSRKSADIIDEVAALVDSGVKEITLLGQNVNSYGKTNSVIPGHLPYSFPQLLRDVSKVQNLKRLRFTTSNPKDLSDDLIACFSDLENLCPQFHLPVQSGSDAVLKRMNRKYNISGYLEKIGKLLEARPDLALSTDIIVGFPGETEQDFAATMELLETVRFHGSFSFKYSDRPGTAAARLDNKIDEKTKSRRLQVFQQRQDEISLERNGEYVGSKQSILIESSDAGSLTGRTATNHIVHVSAGDSNIKPGDFVDIRISSAGQHSLKGLLFPDH